MLCTANAWSGEQRGEQRVAPPSPWGRPSSAQEYSGSESMSEWPSLGGLCHSASRQQRSHYLNCFVVGS